MRIPRTQGNLNGDPQTLYIMGAGEKYPSVYSNEFGCWNVDKAKELIQSGGRHGIVHMMPFEAINHAARMCAVDPEQVERLRATPWRNEPLIHVVWGNRVPREGWPAGRDQIWLIDGADRLRLWSELDPAFVPTYVLDRDAAIEIAVYYVRGDGLVVDPQDLARELPCPLYDETRKALKKYGLCDLDVVSPIQYRDGVEWMAPGVREVLGR